VVQIPTHSFSIKRGIIQLAMRFKTFAQQLFLSRVGKHSKSKRLEHLLACLIFDIVSGGSGVVTACHYTHNNHVTQVELVNLAVA